MLACIRFADALNERVGKGVAWLTLAMVLLTGGDVIARYVTHTGAVAAAGTGGFAAFLTSRSGSPDPERFDKWGKTATGLFLAGGPVALGARQLLGFRWNRRLRRAPQKAFRAFACRSRG
ncbi:MAG: hypothetical protein ACE5JS_07380 [Nitrospinota bacterium]